MKKKPNSIANLSKEFLLTLNGNLIRLKKGMTKNEVILLLGEPHGIEECKSDVNEKLIFKINSGRMACISYSALFTAQELVYVAKLN